MENIYVIFEFFKDLFRKQIIVEKIFSRGPLYPFTRKMKKLGQSDKRGRNDPGDNDPEKVTKLNMKYWLVLYIAIYIYSRYIRMMD